MKKKIFLLLIILFYGNLSLFAQNIKWADKLIKCSSSYHSDKSEKWYNGEQALNYPNVIPGNIKSPCAWQPKETDKSAFIKVGFNKPVKNCKKIIIGVLPDASIIDKIIVSYKNKWIKRKKKIYPTSSWITSEYKNNTLIIDISLTNIENIQTIQIFLKTKKDRQIDCIGYTNSNEKIDIKRKIPKQNSNTKQKIELSEINSDANDILPIITANNRLYFSRLSDFNQYEIWYSDFVDSNKFWYCH